jgi:hypothetical protein
VLLRDVIQRDETRALRSALIKSFELEDVLEASTRAYTPVLVFLLFYYHFYLMCVPHFSVACSIYALCSTFCECDKGKFHVGIEQHGTEHKFLFFSFHSTFFSAFLALVSPFSA